jgi:hypothetical protein
MQIGEKMSKVVEFDELYYLANGDVYENYIAFLQDKPIDTGQLLYVLLRNELDDRIEVEVIFDHFHNEVVAQVTGRNGGVSETRFIDEVRPRAEKLDFVKRIVASVKEAEQWLL